jgi:alpha-1,3-rhamnosyltransferase
MDMLVSVYVITYNSADFVVETLESIKSQTYRNIELVISDDCSKDNTVELCKRWLEDYKSRFIDTRLISVTQNTGMAGNSNRAFMACKGEWVKGIAGDDRLLPNCIESNVNYINAHPDADIVFSKVKAFGDKDSARNWLFGNSKPFFDILSSDEIFILLCQGYNFFAAPSSFIHRQIYKEVGGFEEGIPFLEDRPFWIKSIYHRAKIMFNNDFTVEYRFSPSSVSQSGRQSKTKLLFQDSFVKANRFGRVYLSKYNFFAWMYCKTTYNALSHQSWSWKLLHSINILNPFYYKNRKAFAKFKIVLNQLKGTSSL